MAQAGTGWMSWDARSRHDIVDLYLKRFAVLAEALFLMRHPEDGMEDDFGLVSAAGYVMQHS
jgi:hypothetical protein